MTFNSMNNVKSIKNDKMINMTMQMDCIAIFDSGNYVYHICRYLEKQGFVFEVTSTPCKVAKSGCSLCIRFPRSYADLIIEAGRKNCMPVREIYQIEKQEYKNKYTKIQ